MEGTTQRAAARRRRTPEAAEREILDAADRLLRERPLREVTVSRIMAATTLSRKSFYVYFRNLPALIGRLVTDLRHDADAAIARLLMDDSDMVADGRAVLRALARLYADHGLLIRALVQAADEDPEAAAVWHGLADPMRAGLTERVRVEVRAGRIRGLDPEPVVRALMAMNLACFFEQLVGKLDPDVDGTAEVLFTVWQRTLYADPASLPS